MVARCAVVAQGCHIAVQAQERSRVVHGQEPTLDPDGLSPRIHVPSYAQCHLSKSHDLSGQQILRLSDQDDAHSKACLALCEPMP